MPYWSSASRIAPFVNFSTTFTGTSPLFRGDVAEVRVIELPERFHPFDFILERFDLFAGLVAFALESVRLALEAAHFAVLSDLLSPRV